MHITVKNLKILQTHEPVFIVDVRETWELLEQSIDGALHIPLGHLTQQYEELPQNTPLYILCRSGHRSWQGTLFLRERGLEAYNIQGGIEEYYGNSHKEL